jgi:hypothetical protein
MLEIFTVEIVLPVIIALMYFKCRLPAQWVNTSQAPDKLVVLHVELVNLHLKSVLYLAKHVLLDFIVAQSNQEIQFYVLKVLTLQQQQHHAFLVQLVIHVEEFH